MSHQDDAPLGSTTDSESLQSVFISVSSDRAKWFLDTTIFRELKARFKVHIFGRLSERPEIVDKYGGPNVRWEPEIGQPGSRSKLSYRVFIAARSLGFKYRIRNAEPWFVDAWHRTITYHQLQPLIRRSRSRVQVLTIMARVASISVAWRLLRRFSYGRLVDPQFQRILLKERPTAVLLTGQETPQEIGMSLAADRHGLPSVLVPVSPDDIYNNGYLLANYQRIVTWGPGFGDRLERLHGVKTERLSPCGMLITRLQEELLQTYSVEDERRALAVPAGKRIVSYLSVTNYEAADTVASVTALADAIECGDLENVVIVLRTSPWEDAGGARIRFKDNPHVRVQDSGELPFDTPGSELLARHAALVKASSVLVMGSITSSLFQAATWGIPSILDRSGQDQESKTATLVLFEDADPSGMIADGMPVTESPEELIETIKRYLDSPGWDSEVWRAITDKWDYQDDNYVDNFMRMIE